MEFYDYNGNKVTIESQVAQNNKPLSVILDKKTISYDGSVAQSVDLDGYFSKKIGDDDKF